MSTDPTQVQREQLAALHDNGVLTDTEYADALTRVAGQPADAVVPDPAPPAAAPADPAPPDAVPPDAPPATVVVPVPPEPAPDPSGELMESTVEPAAALTDAPCPNCGRAPTAVATVPTVAANPPIDPGTGTPLEGGETIHHCPHCGHLIAVLEGTIEDAAAAVQADWDEAQADQYADAHPDAPPLQVITGGDGEPVAVPAEQVAPQPTEGSPDAAHEA